MTTQIDNESVWDEDDAGLVTLKLQLLSHEIRKEICADERRIRYENQGNHDDGSVVVQLLAAHKKWIDQWAHKTYEIYCDVWAVRGRSKTGSFLRLVHERGITLIIRSRTNSIVGEFEDFGKRTGYPSQQLNAILEEFKRSMLRLEGRWKTKLEIEARECELKAKGTPPLVIQGKIQSRWASVSGTSKELVVSDFDRLAGRLFDSCLNESKRRRVSQDHLMVIASSLDSSEFVPPLEYLEPACRDKLAAYNNKHARSAAGAIKTWRRLAETKDSSLRRCFRHRLSRAAHKWRQCAS